MHKLTASLFIATGLVIGAMPLGTLSWTTPAPLLCLSALIGLGFVAIYHTRD